MALPNQAGRADARVESDGTRGDGAAMPANGRAAPQQGETALRIANHLLEKVR